MPTLPPLNSSSPPRILVHTPGQWILLVVGAILLSLCLLLRKRRPRLTLPTLQARDDSKTPSWPEKPAQWQETSPIQASEPILPHPYMQSPIDASSQTTSFFPAHGIEAQLPLPSVRRHSYPLGEESPAAETSTEPQDRPFVVRHTNSMPQPGVRRQDTLMRVGGSRRHVLVVGGPDGPGMGRQGRKGSC